MTASNIVYYYYCHQCKKDVSAEVQVSIIDVFYPVQVRLEVSATCIECGAELDRAEETVVLRELEE